ncbi:site-specific integrase [Methylococcus sp. EFPC2]|uniref:tyrosine-type recombinase/integrase n=1 Tax=Methylococcus sp. EFPC2 TaxID=2812648 RepID=UPI001967C382|nr:site-specific integrase [Methylococcus sp. EFPC2]QSA97113.1 tyrosine-type recombinase/integrase [Methylococcus sp. EFPC2]
MASEKIEFTRAALSAITPPAKGRDYFRDVKQAGLLLDVTASGTKAFQLYRKVGGKPVRAVLGRFDPDLPDSRELPKTLANGKPLDPLAYIGNTPRLNVRMARALTVAVSAAMDRGENPVADRREQRRKAAEELTLREAFDLYYKDHLQPQGRRTAEELQGEFARYVGKVVPGQKKPRGKERTKAPGSVDWEGRKLSSIKPVEVRKLMVSLRENVGPRTANKVLALLRALYRKLAEWRAYDGENPTLGIPKYPERERSRFLKAEELPKFFEALQGAPEYFRHFVLLAISTGARSSNIQGMRWVDLDLHAGLWTVPGEQSKNGDHLVIPLTAPALEVLRERRGSGSPWVFPSYSASGHMGHPAKPWADLLERAGLTDLRMHDLRRSLGSWAAIQGASMAIIGQALGHKSTDATRIYARLSVDPVRDAMERATSAIFAAGGIQPTAEVVDLGAKRKAKK